MNTEGLPYDALFSSLIGQEYDVLKQINPLAIEMSRLVGVAVASAFVGKRDDIQVVELGGGTGITTLALLAAKESVKVVSIDNEPAMQNQAKQSLRQWADLGRLRFSGDDALTALSGLPDCGTDAVASAYTLHNFSAPYRRAVIAEVFRILKPGGHFVNGDRYALDDIDQHTRLIQQEVSGYFRALVRLQKLELLEHWIVHMFSDESENHIMRESVAVKQLQEAGFTAITLGHRNQVNALLKACKPG